MQNVEKVSEMRPVKRGKWDILIVRQYCDRWQVDVQCSQCGKTYIGLWSGFFPDVPASIARDAVCRYAKKLVLDNYCSNCGAKMDKEDNK